MADGVNLPPGGTGDTGVKASTQKVTADTSDVQDVSLTSVVGGVRTRNPTIPVSSAAASQADGHSATIGALGDASSASTLVGLLKAIKAAITGTVAVSGTFWQATQPVSGTVTANVGTAGTLALDATLTGGTQKSKLVDTGGTNVATVSAGGALKVDGSAATQPVSGTVTTTPPSNASTNLAQIAGTTPDTNNGNKSAGTLRVTLATDQVQLTNALKVDGSAVTQPVSGTVTTTPPSNASSNVAQINGVTPLMGTGNTGTGSLRVTLATDQVALTNALKVDPSAVTSPVSLATPTSGGYSVSRLLAGASTNATSVKASAGQVYGWYLANAAAYTVFFKLYNKASSPTVGTDTPFMTIPVPAGAAANVEFMRGIAMGTGVAFATTKLVADADTTALVANDLVINLLYA